MKVKGTITRARDLQEDVYIAECHLREEQRKASQAVCDSVINHYQSQINDLQKKINQVQFDYEAGPAKVAIAERELSRQQTRLEEYLGRDEIAKLQKLIEQQLLLEQLRHDSNPV